MQKCKNRQRTNIKVVDISEHIARISQLETKIEISGKRRALRILKGLFETPAIVEEISKNIGIYTPRTSGNKVS